MPCWSTDIGGWQLLPGHHTAEHPPLLDPVDTCDTVGGDDDYPEHHTRWFEYGAFRTTDLQWNDASARLTHTGATAWSDDDTRIVKIIRLQPQGERGSAAHLNRAPRLCSQICLRTSTSRFCVYRQQRGAKTRWSERIGAAGSERVFRKVLRNLRIPRALS